MIDRTTTRKVREGKRATTTYFDPEDYRNLRVLAAKTDKSLQDVIQEACRQVIAANLDTVKSS